MTDIEGDRLTGDSPIEDRASTIMERLVHRPDDLVGLIAYGLYKQEKRDWVIRYGQRYNRRPDVAAMQAFHDSHSDTALGRFRNEAEAILATFVRQSVEDEIPAIAANAVNAAVEQRFLDLSAQLKESGSLWTNIKANVFANLLLLGATVVIVLGIYLIPRAEDLIRQFVAWIQSA